MRALVTGGTGFIGGHLVRQLLGQGDAVRLLVRDGSEHKAQKFIERGAEFASGDILDAPSITAAAQGCDVAYHLAAMVAVAGVSLSDMYAANLDGTENVIAACERAHVHKLVHVSTESVLVDFTDHAGDETAPYPARYRDPYSETKAAAERTVLAAHEAGRVVASIVRPCWVWGPGDTSILPVMVGMAQKGMLTWVGGSRKTTTTTYVGNLVDGIILAAERAESAGEILFIADGEKITVRDFVTRQLALCGITKSFPSVPFPVAMFSATLYEKMHALLGFAGQPALSRYGVALLGCEQNYSIEKAKRLLGYAPRTSVAEGLEKLRVWIEQEMGGVEAFLRAAA